MEVCIVDIQYYNRSRILLKARQMLAANGSIILQKKFFKPVIMKCATPAHVSGFYTKKRDLMSPITVPDKNLSLCFIKNSYYYEFEFNSNPRYSFSCKKIRISEDGNYLGERRIWDSEKDLDIKNEKVLCSKKVNVFMSENEITAEARKLIRQLKKYFFSVRKESMSITTDSQMIKDCYGYDAFYKRIYDSTPRCIFVDDFILPISKKEGR